MPDTIQVSFPMHIVIKLKYINWFAHSAILCACLSVPRSHCEKNINTISHEPGHLPRKANGQATGGCCQHRVPTERQIPLSQGQLYHYEHSWYVDGYGCHIKFVTDLLQRSIACSFSLKILLLSKNDITQMLSLSQSS